MTDTHNLHVYVMYKLIFHTVLLKDAVSKEARENMVLRKKYATTCRQQNG